MIRATASAATARPTVRSASARRPVVLTLLLLTVLALVGSVAVAQRAAADEHWRYDIWVNVDGVAFQRGNGSDEVAYVVRPAGSYRGGQAFSRYLTRDEQNNGWAAFWEARQAYPDGYCVVWVEVEDASSWHESEDSTACTASQPTATPTPTPTPDATQADEPPRERAAAAAPEPAEPEVREEESASPLPVPPPTPSAPPSPRPTPIPTPIPTPSPTPSASISSTPSPAPSHTSPEAALVQNLREQQGSEVRAVAAVEDEVISPLGWVGVLGIGVLLIAGGLLMLWRRLV